MGFFQKPLTWKFCLGATLLFVALAIAADWYSEQSDRWLDVTWMGPVSLYFSVCVVPFLAGTLDGFLKKTDGTSTESGAVPTAPPPPQWTRYVGLILVVYFFSQVALENFLPHHLQYDLGTANEIVWLYSNPLVLLAFLASFRPSANRKDRVFGYLNGLYLLFFVASVVLFFAAGGMGTH